MKKFLLFLLASLGPIGLAYGNTTLINGPGVFYDQKLSPRVCTYYHGIKYSVSCYAGSPPASSATPINCASKYLNGAAYIASWDNSTQTSSSATGHDFTGLKLSSTFQAPSSGIIGTTGYDSSLTYIRIGINLYFDPADTEQNVVKQYSYWLTAPYASNINAAKTTVVINGIASATSCSIWPLLDKQVIVVCCVGGMVNPPYHLCIKKSDPD